MGIGRWIPRYDVSYGSRLSSAVAAMALGVGIVGFVAQLSRLRGWVVDDAYISFRFARNLADGSGLVWNVGGPHVEGYTNALMVFLLAALERMGVGPERAFPWLTIPSALGTVVIGLALTRRLSGRLRLWMVAPFVVYLLYAATPMHAVSGLETQLFVLLLAAVLGLAWTILDRPTRGRAAALALLMFAAVLCRPDALVFLASIGVPLALAALRSREHRWVVAGSLSGAVLLVASYAIWKFTYFGYLLPNSFYVKSAPGEGATFVGWFYVELFLRELVKFQGPLLWVSAAGLAATITRSKIDQKTIEKILLLALPPTVALGYYTTIVHEVGFASRFSYPTYPFCILLIVAAAHAFVKHGRPWRHAAVNVAALATIVLMVRRTNWNFEPEAAPISVQYHQRIADALFKTGLGRRATINISGAGLVPFRSGFNHLDPVGLEDNYLSGRTPVTRALAEQYLWHQRADVYVGWEPPASPRVESVDDEPLFEDPYVRWLVDPKSGVYGLQWKHRKYGKVVAQELPELLFERMKKLRDSYRLVEVLRLAGRLRSFIYVSKESPYGGELARELGHAFDRPFDAVPCGERVRKPRPSAARPEGRIFVRTGNREELSPPTPEEDSVLPSKPLACQK